MIEYQGPGKAKGLTIAQNTAKPLQQILAVGAVTENRTTLDPSKDSMRRGTRHMQAGFAEHEKNLA